MRKELRFYVSPPVPPEHTDPLGHLCVVAVDLSAVSDEIVVAHVVFAVLGGQQQKNNVFVYMYAL